MLDLLMTICSSGGIKSVVSNLDKVQFARFNSEVETSNKQLFTKRFTLKKRSLIRWFLLLSVRARWKLQGVIWSFENYGFVSWKRTDRKLPFIEFRFDSWKYVKEICSSTASSGDGIKTLGGIENVEITQSMLKNVRQSHMRYRQCLAVKKWKTGIGKTIATEKTGKPKGKRIERKTNLVSTRFCKENHWNWCWNLKACIFCIWSLNFVNSNVVAWFKFGAAWKLFYIMSKVILIVKVLFHLSNGVLSFCFFELKVIDLAFDWSSAFNPK